jgi:hypothetical protein
MEEDYLPKAIRTGSIRYSGADMEAALTRAKFQAAAIGQEIVTPEILDRVLDDFMPPTYPEEIELQTLTAVVECTSKALLPERYRSMSREKVFKQVEKLKSNLRV